MEASYPQIENHRCRIVSEEITGQRCLQFWYHMYGMDIDTLNIYVKTNGQLNKPVWTRSRNQGGCLLNIFLNDQILILIRFS